MTSRREEHPGSGRRRRNWPSIEIVVRPSLGQTYADFEKAAEPIRLAMGASQIRITPTGRRDISITFTIRDTLSTAVRCFDTRER